MTLSLCMIVKNEEQTIARCLDSARNCFDEIIIVDTGSDDKTVEIVKQYTDKVYFFPWCDDFSAARNHSFQYATCDYVMWLDADDLLTKENTEKLLLLKSKSDRSIDGYMMPYATAYDEDGMPTYTYYRERIIKNSVPHRWEGRVHETLSQNGKWTLVDIVIYHKSVKETYSERNLKIYEKMISERISFTPRDQFYYGRELYYHKKFKEAEEVLKKYLYSGLGWIENRLEAYRYLSKCYEEFGETDHALKTLLSSFSEALPRPETCCEIGRIFMSREAYEIAIHWYRTAMQTNIRESTGAFVDENYYQYIPCLQLCVCFYKIGEIEQAMKYNELAAQKRPNSPSVQYNRAFFKANHKNALR